MAKRRGRPRRLLSLDGLVAELKQLDMQRQAVISQKRQATEKLLSGESPFPWGRGKAAGAGTAKQTRRRGRKMSAAARKAVGARMKKYWAERRKAQAK
jgi:hypothetical protein